MKKKKGGTKQWSSDGQISSESPIFFTDKNPYPKRNSTTSSDVSAAVNRSHNPVKSAAKVVAGAFYTCFTPPDDGHLHPPTRSSSRQSNPPSGSSGSTLELDPHRMKFTMAQIHEATKNFCPSHKIGQGGFGTVYLATLGDATHVAVKRAKRFGNGKHLGSEFQSEVKTLTKVQHLNLVRLYGYLEEKDERILVVEYVSNGTLRQHLDGKKGDVLDMATRLDIAIDVAHAITYLHMYTDNPIIHRDIKSSNILLTEKHRAKVADFGFARVVADNDLDCKHVSTQVKGTAGYLDPVYLKTYQLTEKSDVYSFGVLLVELVTGRRPIESKRVVKERVTPRWAIAKFSEGESVSTMDPKLEATAANIVALEKILELAFICMALERQNRPSMKECAETLWSIRKDYRDLLASDACSLTPRSRRRRGLLEYH